MFLFDKIKKKKNQDKYDTQIKELCILRERVLKTTNLSNLLLTIKDNKIFNYRKIGNKIPGNNDFHKYHIIKKRALDCVNKRIAKLVCKRYDV